MTRRYFIGLNSGASMLGVHAALVRIDGVGTNVRFHIEHFCNYPYGNELREMLRRVADSPAPELRHLAALHRVLGETFALAIRQLLDGAKVQAAQILCVGCPGQSLWHDPDGRFPATWSIGMTGVVAERTGLTVLGDFCSRDLALGGQGQPISAMVDALLFHNPDEDRVLLHLGSTAGVVWLPKSLGERFRNVTGFEAAPCTMLLDAVMRRISNGHEPMDIGGRHAVQGRCLDALLEQLLQDSLLNKPAPRCLPRREFGAEFLNSAVEHARKLGGALNDVLCTLTHFVAAEIARALCENLPRLPMRILLSGRGVRNGFLRRLLEEKLAPITMETTDAHGIAAEARQAVAHAGLAQLTLDGEPANLPSVTGASGPRLLGQWTPGAAQNWSRCLAWMSQQSAPLQAAA